MTAMTEEAETSSHRAQLPATWRWLDRNIFIDFGQWSSHRADMVTWEMDWKGRGVQHESVCTTAIRSYCYQECNHVWAGRSREVQHESVGTTAIHSYCCHQECTRGGYCFRKPELRELRMKGGLLKPSQPYMRGITKEARELQEVLIYSSMPFK